MSKKKPYIEVVKIFKEYDCTLLLDENDYISSRTHADFICNCGRNGNKELREFYKNPYCSQCGIERSHSKQVVSYEEIKDFIEQNSDCKLNTPKELYKNTQSYIELTCLCGNIFETKFVYFKHENKRQCNECGIKTRSGENAPRWNGGISSENDLIRHSTEYKIWRFGVYKRDGYTCQVCEDNSGGNLHAHHIENFSDNEDIRTNITNGITLCDSCHNPNKYGSFHNVYGTHNNTREQLKEYIERYKNGEFNELKLKNIS